MTFSDKPRLSSIDHARSGMRIVLVDSPPFKIQEAFYDTPPYPRPALAFLAAQLRREGIDVHVLDCKYDRIGYDAALQVIKGLDADIVGFTAFTNEIIQAGRLAILVKEWKPKVTTLVGGVHTTCMPERTLREFPQFDYGIVGEGEQTL